MDGSEGAASINSKTVLHIPGEDMTDIALTRMSSKGQIVVPLTIRKALNIKEGELFAMMGEGDTIVLSKLKSPTEEEFEALLEWGKRFAQKKRIRPRDVMRAIEEARAERG